MILVPYNTDAPIYHFPFATIGLIVVNAIVFAITLAHPESVLPWLLVFGDGLHPLQWVSSNFLHADYMHILGNMFYLWGFGLVVEGKLGWWRFLLVYLAIGAIFSAVIQTAMLGSYGAGLGASGVIFGLMLMALIWAPKNEMSCFLLIFVRPVMFDVSIVVFATTFLAWQGFVAWLSHFSMSSAMAHLAGAAVGALAGIVFLKLNWVDCEGWDLLAVWKGNVGSSREKAEKAPLDSRPSPGGRRGWMPRTNRFSPRPCATDYGPTTSPAPPSFITPSDKRIRNGNWPSPIYWP